MKQIIIYGWYCTIMLAAFFPAYMWYMQQYAWIWYVTTVIFALLTYVPLVQSYGMRWFYMISSLAIVWLVIESIGVLTCIPYGCFVYSEQLWPKLLSIVPYMLVCTWPPLVIGIWSIARKYYNIWHLRWIIGAIWLVLVDLVLDPLAVLMWLWSYPSGWWWRWVPRSNFWWRLISGFIWMMLIDLILWDSYIDHKYYTAWLITTLLFFISYGVWRTILSI